MLEMGVGRSTAAATAAVGDEWCREGAESCEEKRSEERRVGKECRL